MINCILIDDEPLAREVLRIDLSSLAGWNLLVECASAMEAYEALINYDVYVMFLDVQMPRIMGSDFLRSLKNPPPVVFTTAHASFAVEAFELNAVDYLLKPVTLERFQQAVTKVEQLLNQDKPVTPVSVAVEIAPIHDNFVFIKQDSRLVKVSFEDILYLEAKRDFTQIYLKDKKILASFHLKMLESMLPSGIFMRVHRSYIVRLSAIEALNGNTIEMKGVEIPVSNANKNALSVALGL